MSIEIKNTKSATELAGHIERNGEVFFNAGATTGAKKSDYKFNDVTVTVPGTNLQVKINPQETHTFDASADSLAGIALNSAKSELGLNEDNDTPTENIIYITVGESGISSDSTYEEIKAMADNGNVKGIVSMPGEGGETVVFEVNTQVDDEFLKYMFESYSVNMATQSVSFIQLGDIMFYGIMGEGNESVQIGLSLNVSDVWGVVYPQNDSIDEFKDYVIYSLDYENNSLQLNEINKVDEIKNNYYLVVSNNAINHLISLLEDKGYSYKYVENTLQPAINSSEYIVFCQGFCTVKCGYIELDVEAPQSSVFYGVYTPAKGTKYMNDKKYYTESGGVYTEADMSDYTVGDVITDDVYVYPTPVLCPISVDTADMSSYTDGDTIGGDVTIYYKPEGSTYTVANGTEYDSSVTYYVFTTATDFTVPDVPSSDGTE